VLHRRLLLLLVVALSLSTLAAADSARLNTTLPRFATETNSNLSLLNANSTPVSVEAFGTPPATSGNRYGLNVYGMNWAGSSSVRVSSPDAMHNNIRFRTAGWSNGGGHSTAAPEPGSLILLSTGLFGIAGLVRRRIQRG
jgi:hypothetical protein